MVLAFGSFYYLFLLIFIDLKVDASKIILDYIFVRKKIFFLSKLEKKTQQPVDLYLKIKAFFHFQKYLNIAKIKDKIFYKHLQVCKYQF